MIDEQNPLIETGDSIDEKNAILKHNGLFDKTVGEVLAEIDKIGNASKKGDQFEILTQLGLPLIMPETEISKVDRQPSGNPGVDLIATCGNGQKIAIQCKFRSTTAIVFDAIAGFVAAAAQHNEKWLVCNRTNITRPARHCATQNNVEIVDLQEHRNIKLVYIKPKDIKTEIETPLLNPSSHR